MGRADAATGEDAVIVRDVVIGLDNTGLVDLNLRAQLHLGIKFKVSANIFV